MFHLLENGRSISIQIQNCQEIALTCQKPGKQTFRKLGKSLIFGAQDGNSRDPSYVPSIIRDGVCTNFKIEPKVFKLKFQTKVSKL